MLRFSIIGSCLGGCELADGGSGGTSIWLIILMIILFSVFYVYVLGPFTFISSGIVQSDATQNFGIWGFFVAFFPYFVLLGFILIGVLWPIFTG